MGSSEGSMEEENGSELVNSGEVRGSGEDVNVAAPSSMETDEEAIQHGIAMFHQNKEMLAQGGDALVIPPQGLEGLLAMKSPHQDSASKVNDSIPKPRGWCLSGFSLFPLHHAALP